MSEHYEHPPFKVAAVQASPVVRDAPQWFDVEATVAKAVALIEEAGRNGARLIVFPETWLPCYPYWSMDVADGPAFRDIWAKYLQNSIEVPGRETEALGAAAKRANAYVAIGINERDKRFHGRMYNTILYLSRDGEVMGTHRKICNTVQERFFHTPGDGGDNLKAVFRTEIGNIGGSICGEHSQLLLVYNWIMQGMQIHCSLWPGHAMLAKLTDVSTRAVCIAAHAFGVLAATYFSEENRPKNFYRNSIFNVPSGLRGGSGIIGPSGEYIAGPVYDQETIVYGDIDLANIDKALWSTNLVGIYSRWDLINLQVRQQPYEPVVPMEKLGQAPLTSEPDRMENLELRIKQLEQQIALFQRQIPGDDSTRA